MKKTLDLVRNILFSKEYTEKELKDNISFEYPLATSEDKNVKKINCTAKMVVASAYELPITYASQLDDNNEHIVSVGGIMPGDALMFASALSRAVEKTRAPIKEVNTVETVSARRETATAVEPKPDNQETDLDQQPHNPEMQQPGIRLETESTQVEASSTLPSFDCNKAATNSEHLICSSSKLSQADVQLSNAYRSALLSSSNKDALKKEQRAWIKNVREECKNEECMLSAYKNRLAEISR